MTFSLDHVVIAVADLDRAKQGYEQLGFTVLRGGKHPERGSENALIVFQDGTYFELIAFPKPAPGFRWWDILRSAGPGFVDFALLPRNMRRDLEDAQARGLRMGPPEPGGRVTPDGDRAEWQTARAASSNVPFLCGDVTPRVRRVPEGAIRGHANGVTGLAKVSVAVFSLAQSLDQYEALLPGSRIGDAGKSSARLLCPPCIIELLEPAENAGNSPIAKHLATRGEGPVSVSLLGPKPRTLDPARTCGALLRVADADNPYL